MDYGSFEVKSEAKIGNTLRALCWNKSELEFVMEIGRHICFVFQKFFPKTEKQS